MCSYIISECVNYISIAYYYQTHKLKNAPLCVYILYFFALRNKKYSLKKAIFIKYYCGKTHDSFFVTQKKCEILFILLLNIIYYKLYNI